MTTLTALPSAPSRADPTNFSVRGDALMTALETTFVPQMNSVIGELNTLSASVVTNAVTATTQAAAADASAMAAAGAAASAGADAWVSGTTYAIGSLRYSPINFGTYRRKTAGAGTTDPSIDTTNWASATFGIGSGGTTGTTSVTLTSSSAAAMSVTPTTPGLYATLPDATTCTKGDNLFSIYNAGDYDYGVKDSAGTQLGWVLPRTGCMIGLADNSGAAGTWAYYGLEKLGVTAQYLNPSSSIPNNTSPPVRYVALDINRVMLLIGSFTCYAIVYNKATQTWGTLTTVRAGLLSNGYLGVLASTDLVLVCTCDTTTGFEAVTLSVSGTGITVNSGTKASITLAGNITGGLPYFSLIPVSTSFVIGYGRDTTTSAIRAITISGTTPTVGAESALALAVASSPTLWASGSVVRTLCSNTSSISCKPYTVTGSALAAGTAATATTTVAANRAWLNANGNIVVNHINSNHSATIFKLTGTTEAASTVVLSSTDPVAGITARTDYVVISANKTLFVSHAGATTFYANILTDTSGTASVGTEITIATNGNATTVSGLQISGNTSRVAYANPSSLGQFTFDCSGTSPVLSYHSRKSTTGTSALDVPPTASLSSGVRHGSNFLAGTAATVIATGYSWSTRFLPFGIQRVSYDLLGTANTTAVTNTESWSNAGLDNSVNGVIIQRIEVAA